MLKTKIRKFYQYFYQYFKKLTILVKDYVIYVFNSWPKAVIGALVLAVLLYYPLGGALVEKIDRDTNYVQSAETKSSSTISIMNQLVNREVNQHSWTANLPLFFPSYFLDNMPNYQMGMVEAIAVVAGPVSKQIQCAEGSKANSFMTTAAELLDYPGNVWIFAPENRLKIAPSSSSQYRKARKRLNDTNEALENEVCFWHKNPQNLADIISKIQKDLNKASESLEKQINEESQSWFDTSSDDVFYNSQGKAYSYLMILKALSQDYKEVILANNLYQDWTKAIRALENAVDINPQMVRNGELNSSFASNHLISLGYYIAKAQNILIVIDNTLIGKN